MYANNIRQHLVALVQRDDRRRVRRFELGRDRPMDHRPTVDFPSAAAAFPAQLTRKTLAAMLGRRKVRQIAIGTTLIAQLTLLAPLPEGRAHRAAAMRHRAGLGSQHVRSHLGSSPRMITVVNKAPAPPLLHNETRESGPCRSPDCPRIC